MIARSMYIVSVVTHSCNYITTSKFRQEIFRFDKADIESELGMRVDGLDGWDLLLVPFCLFSVIALCVSVRSALLPRWVLRLG